MTKVLAGKHAEALSGGPPVEPGQELPKEADTDEVKRLESRGLVRDRKATKTTNDKES